MRDILKNRIAQLVGVDAKSDTGDDAEVIPASDSTIDERFHYDPHSSEKSSSHECGEGTIAGGSDGWLCTFECGRIDPVTESIHFAARDFVPAIGRWIDQDPVGYMEGANPYQLELSDADGGPDNEA